jgi:hypothetical protein
MVNVAVGFSTFSPDLAAVRRGEKDERNVRSVYNGVLLPLPRWSMVRFLVARQ